MPYMRFIVVKHCLFFSAGLLKAQAQNTLYRPEKEDSRRTNFEIIGKLNGNVLIYKSNRNDDAIVFMIMI